VFGLNGNSDLDSEKLIAYEVGYRVQPRDDLNLDTTIFLNDYHDLVTFEPTTIKNQMHGQGYGFELAARWQPLNWLRFDAAYTFLKLNLNVDSGSFDGARAETLEGSDPHHRFSLRSGMDLGHNLDLDVVLRYTDELPSLAVPSYFAADVRLGWQAQKWLQLNLVGRNLTDSHHPEQSAGAGITGFTATELERSVLGEAVWTF
jgi:iron complex outermembrane receptor protein